MFSTLRRRYVQTCKYYAAGLMFAGAYAATPSASRSFCAVAAESLAELRKEYSRQGINETDMTDNPLDTFKVWLQEARNAKVIEPNAMCLSTCKDNTPTARYVLLKAYDEKGFVWFTNYESRKGNDLEVNPKAAITFWWGDLERSVRIEGRVEKVSAEESDEYFNVRPRGAQIGAWSSNQSRDIESREALAQQEKDTINRFGAGAGAAEGAKVPRPPHWGGYRLVPTRIEFWKGRESRLHDRIVYERKSDQESWTAPRRLQP
jgi:pyridoxamine 5'-phosphate oxidase